MMPQKSGCIINIASHAGIFHSPGQGAHYAASKAGIIQLTRILAFELGPFEIRINAIAPGGVNTAATTIESRDSASNPLGRRGEPEDIAHAALFLASPMASFMTGQTLVVNGGSIGSL
jgi:NAD(P)-dependent dehydrogenase (short-subunit alcohol dehydrogenase family)